MVHSEIGFPRAVIQTLDQIRTGQLGLLSMLILLVVMALVVAAINAGSFPARPANNCGNWCSVRDYCAIVGGSKAGKHDPLLQIQS